MRKNPLFPVGYRGRGERIRTSGPCLPKTVLYQAELYSEQAASHKAPGAPWQETSRASRDVGFAKIVAGA